MADGLPAGTVVTIGRGGGAASVDCGPSVRVKVTVVLLRSVESISPLNATTICGSTMLTMEPLSGDVVATSKCCTALTEASMLIAAAACGAPEVIHCLITSMVDWGR